MTTTIHGIALVTGGSRGIGAEIARTLAAHGADVAITYQSSKDQAEEVAEAVRAEGRRALAVQADATDAAAIGAAVEQVVNALGPIRILVNNAGYADMTCPPLEEVPLATLDRTLDTNVRGAFLTAQAVAASMPDGGRVINLGSCLATQVPAPGFTPYAMSKAAVTGLTVGLARDLGPRNITVNQVSPGSIDTDMNPADGPSADFQRGLNIFGRYGKAGETAAAVLFLASDEASFVTGASLAVDGGSNS
ncbi:SDR family NAD(P)-dependent oxidoreductase [Streptomyces sp. NPDC056149]|uniref:SDR family NAD(P)-dependent oxidoreductase n=1 Tax=unclassified Streptomyces TaxID=2593676 RepID=UPI002380E49A|nr:SDR family oxidoreductase [Streptomyces sp. WZ-12]